MELFSIRIQRTFQLVSTRVEDTLLDGFAESLHEKYGCNTALTNKTKTTWNSRET